MPVKIRGISRICFGRIDRNWAYHCFFGHSLYRPPKRSAPVGYFGHCGLTTENIFSIIQLGRKLPFLPTTGPAPRYQSIARRKPNRENTSQAEGVTDENGFGDRSGFAACLSTLDHTVFRTSERLRMIEDKISCESTGCLKFQPVTHIPISTILVRRGDHEAILVLKAFFDESGHSASSSFVCMGGCIASLEAWSAFEKAWEHVLRKYGITCFHMNHFESNRREFKKWENEPAKHKACLADLINIMNDHIDLYIGTSANVEDHKLSPPPKD